jgi:polysaccharide biosynthesis protein PslG
VKAPVRLWLAVGGATLIVAVVAAIALSGSGAPSTPSATSTSAGVVPRTPSGAGPSAQPAPSGEVFGASVNLLFNGSGYSVAQIATQLRALKGTGATVARSDAFWEAAEPTPPAGDVHHYQWQFDDNIAASLAAAGLRWMPILDYTAPWAQSVAGQDHSPPKDAVDFAAYAGAFAARYDAGGAFWRAHPELTPEPVQTFEIWNEPDNAQFWARAPDAAAYAELYQRARDAILAADPSGRVIVGGLTNPSGFLPAMLSALPQLRGHIDGVGIHPYGNPLVVLAKVRAARAAISSLGLGPVPLYITEFGWTTRPAGTVDYAPEYARPGYLVATVRALGHLDCGVAAALLYTWVSPEHDPRNGQDWYGISSPDSTTTPDVDAFATGLKAAVAARPVSHVC